MLWHTPIAPQRLASRGEVATTWSGLPGLLTGSKGNHDLGRWRN